MHYQEFQPDPILSQHVESYWELYSSPDELHHQFEWLSPDCTFDLLFSQTPVYLKFLHRDKWQSLPPGAAFAGQKTSSVKLYSDRPMRLFGIRFKPFAFANLLELPVSKLNDRVTSLDSLFTLKREETHSITLINKSDQHGEKIEHAEKLVLKLLERSFNVDQTFRAQINYILDRKGLIKVADIFSGFGVTKKTLHKHFVSKMGLSPKTVARIWRLNYLLQLRGKYPEMNLTELGLEAGYYDQAHFIKEFRTFYHCSPRQFFKENSQLVRISQEIIARRFSRQYDPR